MLIIGRVGAKCGVTHITENKSWVTDNALIVNPKTKNFDLLFFKLRLEFENLNNLSVSTAQPVISGSKIYQVEIKIPSLSTQQKVVSEIEHRLGAAEEMEQRLKIAIDKAELMKQSILKQAFEGRLVKEN